MSAPEPNWRSVKITESVYMLAKDYSATSGIRLQHIFSTAVAEYLARAGIGPLAAPVALRKASGR